jgi:basic membrane protein A
VLSLGLDDDGVGLAMDVNNKSMITDESMAAVDKAKAGIIDGSIQVHDYATDSKCP